MRTIAFSILAVGFAAAAVIESYLSDWERGEGWGMLAFIAFMVIMFSDD